MGSNTLRRTTEGASRKFTSILAGAYETKVRTIDMPGTIVENGAPTQVIYGTGPVMNLRLTWLVASQLKRGDNGSE
jgi:hypothetical protein